ncbi:hypothetical protein [Streptomyces sp. NPDC021969]|uniref:hypothetical protein n=1 Tax=unclassified Streptomyces TaxID=2593676 RepID=UPI003411658D
MTEKIPHVTLNNDVQNPLIGCGVFQIPNDQTQKTVEDAPEAAYRLAATAAAHENEQAAGPAAASGIPRNDLFVTTNRASRTTARTAPSTPSTTHSTTMTGPRIRPSPSEGPAVTGLAHGARVGPPRNVSTGRSSRSSPIPASCCASSSTCRRRNLSSLAWKANERRSTASVEGAPLT